MRGDTGCGAVWRRALSCSTAMSSRHVHLSPVAVDSVSHHEVCCGRYWLELWNFPDGDIDQFASFSEPCAIVEYLETQR